MDEKYERLFLAIPVYSLFKNEIDAFCNPLMKEFPGWRWVNLENAHVTLYFFSQFPVIRKSELIATSEKVLTSTECFQIALKDFDVFRDARTGEVKVAWLGLVNRLAAPLQLLYRELTTALRKQHIEVGESKYQPHVTLFRLNKTVARDFSPRNYSFSETSAQLVQEVVLYRSTLTGAGPIYTKDWIYEF